jgi:hypothetical protein
MRRKVTDAQRAIIQGRVLKFMLNQIARGALDDKVLREATLHNLTNMIITDVETALISEEK